MGVRFGYSGDGHTETLLWPLYHRLPPPSRACSPVFRVKRST